MNANLLFRSIRSWHKEFLEPLGALFRRFPYIDLSTQYIPVFAYLYINGLATHLSDLALLLPFIFGHAAGFAYNNLEDDGDPAFRGNPVEQGQIDPQTVRWMVIGLLLLSLVTFALFYSRWQAWLAYIIYVLLGLAYSGLGLRLKESLLGPFVAAYALYTAGPLAIALDKLPSWAPGAIGLLVGVYLVFVGREIFHTYIDRENDLQTGYQTFGVRLSIKTQLISLALACIGGSLVLAWSMVRFSGGWPQNGLGLAAGACILAAAGLQIRYTIRFAPHHPVTAFIFYRLGFVLYGAYILDLAPLVAALFIWVFLINRKG